MAVLSKLDGVKAVRFDIGEPLPPGAEEAEVLVPGFQAGKRALRYIPQLPKLKLVQLLSAGVESWIGELPDGVMLANGRGAHGGSTAEWVMAALLTVYREMREFDHAQRERRWDARKTGSLQGERVLVIGAGDLGNQLRRRLEAFDSHVTMVGTTAREGVHGTDELPALLGEHDVVVLVVPVTARTAGMVDAEFLARMADGALLVNAARGSVVVTDDLLAELRSGRLRAALDVTDPEPLPPGHPLWTAPGLLLTPHVAGTCTGNIERGYAVAASQIAMFVAGGKPANLVRGEY